MRRIFCTFLIAVSVAGCGDDGPAGNLDGNIGPGGDGGDGGDGGSVTDPDAGPRRSSVTVHLERIAPGGAIISFGLPLPAGAVKAAADVRVAIGGRAVAGANVAAILSEHDANGDAKGIRSVVIQLPAAALTGTSADVDILWDGSGTAPGSTRMAFAMASAASPEVVTTADRTIRQSGTTYALVETATAQRTLFTGREPTVLATYPAGYLAEVGLMGPQRTAADVARSPALAGMKFLSDALLPFARSAMYRDRYKVNPEAVVDPMVEYEGWLYDRCATFLTVYTHTGDLESYRHALRSCSYYASKINLTGPNPGIFSGKPDPDTKYSHLRGLYAYYALTGDESALAAGTAIADLWKNDAEFTIPYRMGRLRGLDKLWTERLLGTSMEGLYYGHRLTGDKQYLVAFRELLTTAHTHITTTDQAVLMTMTGNPFPPQDCFIHNAAQHSEGDVPQPWCSGWMSELTLDALLRYQEQTADPRVDEIFVRLARFLRDTGSSYFDSDIHADSSFLKPTTCYNAAAGEDVRRLVPLYGAGLNAAKVRSNFGEYDDYEHCADGTALTAAALRALKRQGKFDQGGPIGPFATEGQSLLALHQELAACAKLTFQVWDRQKRDPANWTSGELAAGAADPVTFIRNNKIGHPSRPSTPQRKLSWWFNMSMLDLRCWSRPRSMCRPCVRGRSSPRG